MFVLPFMVNKDNETRSMNTGWYPLQEPPAGWDGDHASGRDGRAVIWQQLSTLYDARTAREKLPSGFQSISEIRRTPAHAAACCPDKYLPFSGAPDNSSPS